MRNSNVSTFARLFVFLFVGQGGADVAGESILDLDTFLPTDTALLMGSPDSALPPLPGVSDNGEIERPPVLATEPDHPIMRFLLPENVSIAIARRSSSSARSN